MKYPKINNDFSTNEKGESVFGKKNNELIELNNTMKQMNNTLEKLKGNTEQTINILKKEKFI